MCIEKSISNFVNIWVIWQHGFLYNMQHSCPRAVFKRTNRVPYNAVTEYISLAIGLYYWGVCSSWVECHFSLPLVYQCVLLSGKWSNTRMLVIFGTCFKQHFDTRYCFYTISHLPECFLPLDLLSEYRFQHGAIGPLYVTSSYSTWTFCRGVSDFATECRCGVWCWYVGPPFWKSNLKQQLGCRFDLMDSNNSLPMCLALWEMV